MNYVGAMNQLFDVMLCVRNEYGQLTGTCEGVYITFRGQFGVLADFESSWDGTGFCSFHIDPGVIFFNDQKFEMAGYHLQRANLYWDLVVLDCQSMTKLWRLFVDRFWHGMSLVEAETFLYDRWNDRAYVDFAIYEHQTTFYWQMYQLCGRSDHVRDTKGK